MECSLAFNLGYVTSTKLKMVKIYFTFFSWKLAVTPWIEYRITAFETTH